jgi:hypothetical protein
MLHESLLMLFKLNDYLVVLTLTSVVHTVTTLTDAVGNCQYYVGDTAKKSVLHTGYIDWLESGRHF